MNDDDSGIVAVMHCMPYGLYIVGSIGESGPNGMMVDWVTQVSFQPRLISAAIENDAHTLANIRATGVFTLNFLSEGPEGMNLARHFAAPFKASKIGGPTALGVRPKLATNAYRESERCC
ncbi:MAG TPA: flavin reductase family protein, partial [Dehalococcoidia bacterium]|nr:flavin reductase family protein [Dehalococcoidia bacterium]